MGVEFEVKYQADETVQRAIRNEFTGLWETICMQTTYFDTPEGALARKRYTLRCRQENERTVCTVKTPAYGIGRGEWDVQETEIVQAIPMLCKLGCPQELLDLTQNGVIAICGAKFTRHALTISFRNSRIELALDSGVLFAADRQIPLCEVEAELKEGCPEDVQAFGRLLEDTYHMKPETKSKFKRAQALIER